jgi:hypothetical protein
MDISALRELGKLGNLTNINLGLYLVELYS